jgi:pimeloyl-ACP methyl ester carboxylesterase
MAGLAVGAAGALVALSGLNVTAARFRARRRARKNGRLPEGRSTPVLFVPGTLGTTLVDPAHGDFPVWGSYRGCLFYRRKYEDLDLSILPERETRLRPGSILWTFPVAPGLFHVPVFEDFRRSMLAAGYAMGDLGAPRARRALYPLVYDWRRDVVDGARAVEKAVATLCDALGVEQVHLVGVSWGCTVVRYFLRYGGADVLGDSAEEPRPGAARAATFYAVGDPSGGSLRAFNPIMYGYSPSGPVGRSFSAHHVASCPAAYQLLRFAPGLVIDESGREVALDMASADTWKDLRLGPFRPATFRALHARARRHAPGLRRGQMLGAVERFLAERLQRSRRLGDLLGAPDAADRAVRTVTYATRSRETLCRMVLSGHNGRRRLVSTHRAVRRRYPELAGRVTAPGDRYVTFDDVLRTIHHRKIVTDPHETPEDSYVFVTDSGSHRKLFRTHGVLTNLLLDLDRKSHG